MIFDLALIDLDGTITDSAPGIVSSIELAYDALGVPRPSDDDLRRFVGPPIEESARRHGIEPGRVAEFVSAYRSVYSVTGLFDNSVYPGMAEALVALRAAGVRCVVATSKPEVYARQILEHFGLDDLFEHICGSTLDGTRTTKADVVAYALATVEGSERGLPERARVTMVGDREHDVLGAREHGIGTIAVGWGYAAPGELAEAAPAAVVDTPEDLVAAVSG
ncbi:HAD hydrolase-like protein [Sanguibacter antarcticus]|uniref:Tyrosine-protein kinase PtkA n=1 Tax=Sanguibacter antarcticus TaxID=372484 RepID=A0A2A9E8Z5_9MICO|nr:HAD hydrolase-like protein [Sanguibacter antarcticus]PFG35011.1 phosphoglycolate phosphatase [Sanguibacter antarcticus]